MASDPKSDPRPATRAGLANRRARARALAVEAGGAVDPPRPDVLGWLAAPAAGTQGRAASSAPPAAGGRQQIAATGSPSCAVNAPITWGQFLGALLGDLTDPALMGPVVGALVNWVGGPEPFTARAVVSGGLLAVAAGYKAARAATGSSQLQLRLRAAGQIDGGQ